MSDRERWIVYPLLFFALMLGVADLWQRMGLLPVVNLAGPPRFKEIRCQRLVLEGIDHSPLAVLTQNAEGDPQLSMYGDSGKVVILRADAGGGRLLLVRDSDRQAILLGHDAETEFSGATAVKFVEQRAVRLDANDQSISLLPVAAEENVSEVDIVEDNPAEERTSEATNDEESIDEPSTSNTDSAPAPNDLDTSDS